MNKINILIILFFQLSLHSCDSSVTGNIDFEYEGDRLTLNGFLSTDSIKIYAGKTVGIVKSVSIQDFIVPGIVVTVHDESGRQWPLTSKDGIIFRAPTNFLVPGNTYRVRAKASGYTSVETDQIDIPVPLTTTTLVQNGTRIWEGNEEAAIVTLAFDDPPGKNFYTCHFLVQKGQKYLSAASDLSQNITNRRCYDGRTFNDLCFDGQRTEIEYEVRKNHQFTSNTPVLADSIVCYFGGVSEQFYQHWENYPKNDGFIDGLQELPITYTNVKNGFGVVYGRTWKVYKIVVQ